MSRMTLNIEIIRYIFRNNWKYRNMMVCGDRYKRWKYITEISVIDIIENTEIIENTKTWSYVATDSDCG